MTTNEIILGVVLVVVFALIYSLLDRKFESFRMGPLYRPVFWQNFLVNIVILGIFYFLLTYFLG